MLKNTETFDYMFIHTFGEDEFEDSMDFPLIALDFLRHYYPEISKYSENIFAEDSMAHWGALKGIRFKILNMMLTAARAGESYAQEMLCRLYKVYYKKEFNQLKRFHQIHLDELESFENDYEMYATTAARILTICPFMGIEVDEDCMYAAKRVERILNDPAFEFKIQSDFFSFKEGIYEAAIKEAEQLRERIERKKGDFFLRNDYWKFKVRAFRYLGSPDDYDLFCDVEWHPLKEDIAVTLALLKTVWPKKTFSDEEVMLYLGIYRTIKTFTDHIDYLDEMVDMMIGRTDKFAFQLERCRYQPEQQKVIVAAQSTKQKQSGGVKRAEEDKRLDSTEKEAELRAMEEENAELKAALKTKQQSLEDLALKIREMKEEVRRCRAIEENQENVRDELNRLREYVYSMTEEDISVTTVSLDEMSEFLSKKRIIIIGGHDNWTNQLKERFPGWTFIKPSASGTIPERAAIYADYLFFFTDTVSHSAYNKYMNVVRRHNLPFSYLHGTNIEKTIRSVYLAVKQ